MHISEAYRSYAHRSAGKVCLWIHICMFGKRYLITECSASDFITRIGHSLHCSRKPFYPDAAIPQVDKCIFSEYILNLRLCTAIISLFLFDLCSPKQGKYLLCTIKLNCTCFQVLKNPCILPLCLFWDIFSFLYFKIKLKAQYKNNCAA